MKLCPRCGETKPFDAFYKNRRTSDGLRCYCKACGKRASTEWQKANPGRAAAANARTYAKHKDNICAKTKARREANPSLFAEYRARAKAKGGVFFNAQRRLKRQLESPLERAKAQAYRQANAGRYNAHTRRYRAKVLSATPAWADERAVGMFYDVAARISVCTGLRFEVDHIVPLHAAHGSKRVASGLHVEYNLRIVPRTVNRTKSNQHWPAMPVRSV